MITNGQATEAEIRSELKIPPIGDPTAQRVIILSQSSHLDWDWLLPFSTLLDRQPPDRIGYFDSFMGSAREIFSAAGSFLSKNGAAGNAADYYYSICEIGFLKGFAARYPADFEDLKGAGTNLRIVGGGITSPDNLLPDGECFIRNYLLGRQWLDSHLPGLAMDQAWLPDDFGHDSQLPVLMQALGFQGVGFGRVPPRQAASLATEGVDFVWEAADGSTTFAHWMQFSYSQGQAGIGEDPVARIGGYYTANSSASKTDYVFVPVGDDFALPQDLPACAAAYNQNPQPGVYAVAATFDHYVQLVTAYWTRTGATATSHPFYPTPLWTGYYASRPANKLLHHRASRALLGAEVLAKIFDCLQCAPPSGIPVVYAPKQAIRDGWEALAPSTHHDYITGTAVDAVYTGEQQPLLKIALAMGERARQIAAAGVAESVNATPASGETPVAVFNQLGFAYAGLVEMPAAPGVETVSVRTAGGPLTVVQTAGNGNLLFMSAAPSLGYETAYLSAAIAPPQSDPTMSLTWRESPDGTEFELSNYYLNAVISTQSCCGLSVLQDTNGGTSSVDLIPRGETGNDLLFYIDYGDIYQFRNEENNPSKAPFSPDASGALTVIAAEWVERGPLRLKFRTVVQFASTDSKASGIYTREYSLVAGEPFLRMSMTGAAPLTADGAPTSVNFSEGNPYAVMVRFPFAEPVETLSYGTTYHWDSHLPTPPWSAGPTFLAAHDFLLPEAHSASLGAIYHSSIPAWAIDESGSLIGCVLRNSPSGGNNLGAIGSDPGVHTHHYAIRMPSAVEAPSTGAPLRESRQFQTPLLGAYIEMPEGGYPAEVNSFPATFSLASVSSGSAILTAAKSAEADSSALVLRIYQPTNTAVEVGVTVSTLGFNQPSPAWPVSARKVTALETEIPGQDAIPVNSQGAFSFTANLALTTLLIQAASPPS